MDNRKGWTLSGRREAVAPNATVLSALGIPRERGTGARSAWREGVLEVRRSTRAFRAMIPAGLGCRAGRPGAARFGAVPPCVAPRSKSASQSRGDWPDVRCGAGARGARWGVGPRREAPAPVVAAPLRCRTSASLLGTCPRAPRFLLGPCPRLATALLARLRIRAVPYHRIPALAGPTPHLGR